MREILFRGKSIVANTPNKPGYWMEGNLFHQTRTPYDETVNCYHIFDGNKIIEGPDYETEVWPETVGQFTGLLDKNDKKIFEGDICKFREWDKGDMCWIGKVHYEHQQFVISGGPNEECATSFTLCMSRFIPENIEVIGNIHDNPELMR